MWSANHVKALPHITWLFTCIFLLTMNMYSIYMNIYSICIVIHYVCVYVYHILCSTYTKASHLFQKVNICLSLLIKWKWQASLLWKSSSLLTFRSLLELILLTETAGVGLCTERINVRTGVHYWCFETCCAGVNDLICSGFDSVRERHVGD